MIKHIITLQQTRTNLQVHLYTAKDVFGQVIYMSIWYSEFPF